MMKSKKASIAVLCMMVLGFVVYTPVGAAIISSTSSVITSTPTTTKSSTTIDQCAKTLCGTLNPQNQTFDPSKQPNYFGTDLGKFSTQTDPDGFVWSTGSNDFLIMGLPTVGATSFVGNRVLYFNSSHTAYKFSGAFGSLSVFFKPAQYKVKISIEANLASPQSVCLPFTSGNPIVQQSSNFTGKLVVLPSIRAGNQIFDFSDIPALISPTWSSSTNSICMSLPIGITNVDPLALDGSGLGSSGSGTTCTVTLTTTTTNDVVEIASVNNGFPISSVSGGSLTWSDRKTLTMPTPTARLEVWYAIAASTLSSVTITATYTGITTYCQIQAWGVSGANTGTPFDSDAGLPYTHTTAGGGGGHSESVNINTANANDFIYGAVRCNTQPTAGAGYTGIQLTSFFGAEYQIVAATQTSFPVNFTTCDPESGIIADAIQQAVTNQPVVLVLKVNPSPSPEGGGIAYSCTPVPVPCANALTTTISSSLSFTFQNGLGATITMDMQEFSAYIPNGWTGATTLVSDTINPNQIITIASFTTTTQSKTLTANFVNPVAAGGAPTPNYLWLLVIPLFMVVVFAIARRR
jgi:hypothetical protein